MALQDFRDRFPEFAGTADDVVESALDEAHLHHSATVLGMCLVAAHLLEHRTTGRPAASGEITEVTVAGQTVKSVPQSENGSESFYASTEYGRRYLALRKKRAVSAVAVYR